MARSEKWTRARASANRRLLADDTPPTPAVQRPPQHPQQDHAALPVVRAHVAAMYAIAQADLIDPPGLDPEVLGAREPVDVRGLDQPLVEWPHLVQQLASSHRRPGAGGKGALVPGGVPVPRAG